jgi:hypothetical protein
LNHVCLEDGVLGRMLSSTSLHPEDHNLNFNWQRDLKCHIQRYFYVSIDKIKA